MVGEDCHKNASTPMALALRYARHEAALRAFVYAQRRCGLITDDHAREIEEVANTLYRRAGMLTDPNDQRPIHSSSDIQAMTAVARDACQLIERRLLELYPGLINQVKQLGASAQFR